MTEKYEKAKPTRVDKMERWLRDQPVLSILIVAGIIFLGIAEIILRGSDILLTFGYKEEKTLKLSQNTAKGEFSRRLTDLAWRRIFWTNNYLAKLQAGRPHSELDYAWNKHLDTVADWSASYLANLQSMDEFYPLKEKRDKNKRSKAERFEEIHENLRDFENCRLVPLRMAESDGKEQNAQALDAKEYLDKINENLYYLVLNTVPGKPDYEPPTISRERLCPKKESPKDAEAGSVEN